jgi:hypothetical protein
LGAALHDKLAEFISSSKGARLRDKDAVMCLAKSMLYEKSNRGYMYSAPKELERYIADFATEETVIVDGPNVAVCNGTDGKKHTFLSAEGINVCTQCKVNLCRFCCIKRKDATGDDDADKGGEDIDGYVCFGCARSLIAGDVTDKTESDMRVYLREKGQNVPASATYADVLNLYQQSKRERGETKCRMNILCRRI